MKEKTKDTLIVVVIALLLLAFGAATWLRPDALSSEGSGPTIVRGRILYTLLNLVWNRPAGTIAILLGVAAIDGLLTGKRPGNKPPAQDKPKEIEEMKQHIEEVREAHQCVEEGRPCRCGGTLRWTGLVMHRMRANPRPGQAPTYDAYELYCDTCGAKDTWESDLHWI